MKPERWRCFVAVPLGDQLRRELAASVDSWRSRADLEGLRWTDPDGWHVTLAFLGSVDPAETNSIAAAVGEVAATHDGIRLRTGGVGAFPSAGHARVAWYGVHDVDRTLRGVANDLRGRLAIEAGGPFRAHVTLARARGQPVDLRGWIGEASAPEGELHVDHLDLMRSHLGRGPARYEVLASAPMRVRTHA